MFMSGCLTLWGVPAKRDVFTVIQPDGTTLQVRKAGDEFRHFITTADGMVLTKTADGAYCYASLSDAGMLRSTGVRAVDPHLRSAVPTDAISISDVSALKKVKSGPKRIPQTGVGLCETSFPSKGEPNVLVILVEYTDVKFTLDDPKEYFSAFLNEEGFSRYGGTGSCKDYFRDNSKGQFVPHFDMYGPVTLPEKRSYYGGNDIYGYDKNPEMMVVHAIESLDPDVDFSIYDNDGDGFVDNVYVFYAGRGEASSNEDNAVWPHSYDLEYAGLMFEVDGVKVNHYACSNEWDINEPTGIGTFVHEFSHVMGLPDLYHTEDAYASYTPGAYSVLDYGPYNNDGRTPPAYSIYERNAMGWMEPEIISEATDGRLEHILDSNHGYIIPTSDNNEFFLLENRQRNGWDKYIPGHGMLIWHIDYERTHFENNTVNNSRSHQYVDIEEAGGRTSYDDGSVQASYTFPGAAGVTSFTDDTTPSMRTWAGDRLNLPITEISEDGGVITFLVADGGTSLQVPTPFEAERIEKSDSHFVAAWEPVEGATDYEVTVYSAGEGEPREEVCDMGNSSTLSLPAGWSSNTSEVYKTAGNYGNSSPSMKFSSTGVYLLTPDFNADVTAVSYWRKGQNTNGSSVLNVYGLTDNGWVLIDCDEPENGVGSVHTIAESKIPEGVRQLKFEYTKSAGNLALDDIKISVGGSDEVLMPYKDYSTEGATTLRVDNLKEGCTTYRFKVRARDEKRPTPYSKSVTVELPEQVGIEKVSDDAAPVEYFDMLGRRVKHPSSGTILIERCGPKARKVRVR